MAPRSVHFFASTSPRPCEPPVGFAITVALWELMYCCRASLSCGNTHDKGQKANSSGKAPLRRFSTRVSCPFLHACTNPSILEQTWCGASPSALSLCSNQITLQSRPLLLRSQPRCSTAFTTAGTEPRFGLVTQTETRLLFFFFRFCAATRANPRGSSLSSSSASPSSSARISPSTSHSSALGSTSSSLSKGLSRHSPNSSGLTLSPSQSVRNTSNKLMHKKRVGTAATEAQKGLP
mmetsp:Transcript_2400/g.5442  ORF Transcript_2400/g.5442 Transcript_2400/m.5442 type:complete len:236 (-) Transcript_2400:12-719(-)